MFSKVLIANRGEIAVRIARTCRRLGIASVAVFSDADEGARHVAATDESMRLPGRSPAETYLDAGRVIEAAKRAGAEAVHPGYGFLSENADFAEAVRAAGMTWVGPPPAAIRALGDKISARRIAAAAGVPVVPGLLDEVTDAASIIEFAAEHGWPVAIKAAGGGGGRGLKVAHSPSEIDAALASARREGAAFFGSPVVYVERYLDAPKHLEVQILATTENEALWLGVRDCSLQRRHQKLIEESPPPRWAERAIEMGEAAVALSKASGYVNAGTVEMLVDDLGYFYFLEVNSRLQVEHTVTEEVLGIDLVECQLLIASGDGVGLSQDDLAPRGHAIECRINAEDPARAFAPSPGRLVAYNEPSGPSLRVDSGYGAGDEIPAEYDSLIAKVITSGRDREDARQRMIEGLQAFEIAGVATTIPAHLLLLEDEDFVRGTHTTRTVEHGALAALSARGEEGTLLVDGRAVRLWHPAMSASAAAAVHADAGSGKVTAPMHGTIVDVLVDRGGAVQAGDPLMVLEAMKMETTLFAPRHGTVTHLGAETGTVVGAGEILAIIE